MSVINYLPVLHRNMVHGKQLDNEPSSLTEASVFVYIAFTELLNFPSILLTKSLYNRASLSTKSKAFCKSMNVVNVLFSFVKVCLL